MPDKQSLIRCLNRKYPLLEIIIISFQFPAKDRPYKWEGNTVIPLSGKNKAKGRQLITWLKAWRQLRRLHGQKDILGVLSFFCTECCLIGHFFCKTNGLKHLCWISGQDAKKNNGFVRYIRPDPGELVAMSDFLMATFAQNHGICPKWLITDGVDRSLFGSLTGIRDIDIIVVGSLSALKQFSQWVDVIARLKVQYPGLKAYLCGDGEQRTMLQDKIRALGLQETITLTGVLPQKEVLQLLQRSRILIHPSRYEGFGNVFLEALYAGARVISFVRPMLRDVSGWFIVQDLAAMAAQADALLEFKDELTHEHYLLFDMEASAARFMQLFEG